MLLQFFFIGGQNIQTWKEDGIFSLRLSQQQKQFDLGLCEDILICI